MMGNVKAFILSICSAVVFATLLGFGKHDGDVDPRADSRSRRAQDSRLYPARSTGLFVSEAVALSLAGGIIGREPGLL